MNAQYWQDCISWATASRERAWRKWIASGYRDTAQHDKATKAMQRIIGYRAQLRKIGQ